MAELRFSNKLSIKKQVALEMLYRECEKLVKKLEPHKLISIDLPDSRYFIVHNRPNNGTADIEINKLGVWGKYPIHYNDLQFLKNHIEKRLEREIQKL